jgi:hypothetical protein
LFTFEDIFVKISVDLKTSLAAETNLADGQWLRE